MKEKIYFPNNSFYFTFFFKRKQMACENGKWRIKMLKGKNKQFLITVNMIKLKQYYRNPLKVSCALICSFAHKLCT